MLTSTKFGNGGLDLLYLLRQHVLQVLLFLSPRALFAYCLLVPSELGLLGVDIY